MFPIRFAETLTSKSFDSPDYHYRFDKRNGTFFRWGVTTEEDPQYAPFPEIADIEISKNGCIGFGHGLCSFCYKSSTSEPPENMTVDTFKRVLHPMLPFLTQIAFGVTSIHANMDFLTMMKYARAHGVIPNFTTTGADLDDEFLAELPGLVGAVAVSCYPDQRSLCYSTVLKLKEAGISQTNIHLVNTGKDECYGVIDDVAMIPEVNALVLLSLKPKGRASKMDIPTVAQRRGVIQYAMQKGVRLGLDSCSAHDYIDMYGDSPEIEPCESGLFSCYVNCRGEFSVCSFGEDIEPSIPVGPDFLDVWQNQLTGWRERLLGNKRHCPLFDMEA